MHGDLTRSSGGLQRWTDSSIWIVLCCRENCPFCREPFRVKRGSRSDLYLVREDEEALKQRKSKHQRLIISRLPPPGWTAEDASPQAFIIIHFAQTVNRGFLSSVAGERIIWRCFCVRTTACYFCRDLSRSRQQCMRVCVPLIVCVWSIGIWAQKPSRVSGVNAVKVSVFDWKI